jgi:alkylation response protein AidB-like acyl-CoA dehydrogenase
MTGDLEFNEVFLDGARVPDTQRVGPVNGGWIVAGSTLSSERQMVARGSGSTRVGAPSVDRLIALAKKRGRAHDPLLRSRLASLWIEERIRQWTNVRVDAIVKAGGAPGPAASIGKVHQADLNQRIQILAVDILGPAAMAWEMGSEAASGSDRAGYHAHLVMEVNNMLRSRANSIEGGTTEVNKNVLGERVLGFPREPDPWRGRPWSEVPR